MYNKHNKWTKKRNLQKVIMVINTFDENTIIVLICSFFQSVSHKIVFGHASDSSNITIWQYKKLCAVNTITHAYNIQHIKSESEVCLSIPFICHLNISLTRSYQPMSFFLIYFLNIISTTQGLWVIEIRKCLHPNNEAFLFHCERYKTKEDILP